MAPADGCTSGQPALLQTVPSNKSSGSAAIFKPPSSTEGLGGLGLTPVPKVRVRSTLHKKHKLTALDKQYRHVALIQNRNRQRAAAQQQQQQEQQAEQQQLADLTLQLCSSILAGDVAAVEQTWQPAAAAARLREYQEAVAQETQQLTARLPAMVDPLMLRAAHSSSCKFASAHQQDAVTVSNKSAMPSEACICHSNSRNKQQQVAEKGGAADVLHDADAAAGDDVDGFLDALLQQATAIKASSSNNSSNKSNKSNKSNTTSAAVLGGCSDNLSTSQQPTDDGSCPCPPSAQYTTATKAAVAVAKKQQQQQQQQQQRQKPAWALTERQQAEAAAAAEASEEAELLDFAEQLSWEQLVGQMDDEQLAEAFKELELAEQQAAAGDPAVDKQWQRCFVTALNHAAMKDVAAAVSAAAAGSKGEQDGRSEASSASQARRAEAVAARRQKLLARLSRLGGETAAAGTGSSSGSVAAAAAAAAAVPRAGSACGSHCGSMMSNNNNNRNNNNISGAADVDWDWSTRAGDDVAQLTAALKTLEAGDVLAENPEMKGTHSVASVRSMLMKMEAQKGPV